MADILGTPLGETINGTAFADFILAGAGADIVNGGDGNDNLYGHGFDIAVSGVDDGASDTLNGGAGDDLLSGGLGEDFINGGDGNDTLRGNSVNNDDQHDELQGGDGDDTFVADFLDTVVGGIGTDSLYLVATSAFSGNLTVNLTRLWSGGVVNYGVGGVGGVTSSLFFPPFSMRVFR